MLLAYVPPKKKILLVSPDGFEPPTTGFEDQYSILLSYGPA